MKVSKVKREFKKFFMKIVELDKILVKLSNFLHFPFKNLSLFKIFQPNNFLNKLRNNFHKKMALK